MCNARPCIGLHGRVKAKGIKQGTEDTVPGRGEQTWAMHDHALGCTAVQPTFSPQLCLVASYDGIHDKPTRTLIMQKLLTTHNVLSTLGFYRWIMYAKWNTRVRIELCNGHKLLPHFLHLPYLLALLFDKPQNGGNCSCYHPFSYITSCLKNLFSEFGCPESLIPHPTLKTVHCPQCTNACNEMLCGNLNAWSFKGKETSTPPINSVYNLGPKLIVAVRLCLSAACQRFASKTLSNFLEI
ncbi:hypothetical protein L1987_70539 [Smallanthus sonchifolius]|uniref:Uncharacterized protein n=1 Tax=Smallanthus sonchifolius TaxID=185202 RepID=A0ACB9AQS9_9ASTR|nr:hypothetical protein L1987_70539 [Smallanthus sonchifolius]